MDNTVLRRKQIVLASGSPRRKILLKSLGLSFKIFTPKIQERFSAKFRKKELRQIALAKADAAPFGPRKIIIACDTIVVCRNKVLGKPRDPRQARQFLQLLSGRKHTVYSCLALKYQKRGQILRKTRVTATGVYFRKLSAAEIAAYSKTPAPYDKAGGYGIQETRGLFVRKIKGCYYNVVGLPVTDLIDMLGQI
ncbi:MAG: Maf family protein [Candidatus Margulisbacteria bacterium]|nr:Maf family protein [Candidatus Margulisiibacteriota bacterium]